MKSKTWSVSRALFIVVMLVLLIMNYVLVSKQVRTELRKVDTGDKVVFVLNGEKVFDKMTDCPYASDMDLHFEMGIHNEGYSLLHVVIYAMYRITGENIEVTRNFFSALITLCNGLTIVLLCWAYSKIYKVRPNGKVYFFSISAVLVTAFLAQYGNTVCANVWHNPTYVIMRPASIVIVVCTWMAFENYKNGEPYKKYLWINAIATAFSMWAKPSFLQAFLPALCICLLIELIKTRGKSFLFSFKLGASFLSCIPILIYQLLWSYFQPYVLNEGGESGIRIKTDWTAWEVIDRCASLFYSSIFVFIGILLLWFCKRTNKRILLFSTLWYAISVFFYSFVKETGPRAGHGNFSWSIMIAIFFLMAFIIGELFIKPEKMKSPKILLVLSFSIYAVYLICGICYFLTVFMGMPYYGGDAAALR